MSELVIRRKTTLEVSNVDYGDEYSDSWATMRNWLSDNFYDWGVVGLKDAKLIIDAWELVPTIMPIEET